MSEEDWRDDSVVAGLDTLGGHGLLLLLSDLPEDFAPTVGSRVFPIHRQRDSIGVSVRANVVGGVKRHG